MILSIIIPSFNEPTITQVLKNVYALELPAEIIKEIILVDELRILRNKITYDGFFVRLDFLERNVNTIKDTINKLKLVVNDELKE